MGSIPPTHDVALLLQAVTLPEIPIPAVTTRGTATPVAEPAGVRTTVPDRVALSPSGVQAMVAAAITVAERQTGSLLGAVQALASQPADAAPSTMGQLAGRVGSAAQDLGTTIMVLTAPTATAAPDAPHTVLRSTPPGMPLPAASLPAPRRLGETLPSAAPASSPDPPASKQPGPTPATQPSRTPDLPAVAHGLLPFAAPDRPRPDLPQSPPASLPHAGLVQPHATVLRQRPAPAPLTLPDIVRPALERATIVLQAANTVLGRAEAVTRHGQALLHEKPGITTAARAEPASTADRSPPATPDLLWCQAQLATAMLHVGAVLQRANPNPGPVALSPFALLFMLKSGTKAGPVRPVVIIAVSGVIAAFALGSLDFTAARIAAAIGLAIGGSWLFWRRSTTRRRITLRLRP